MPRRQPSPESLQEIRDLAPGWGKGVARRAEGAAGSGLDVDFDLMEQIARAAAAGLTEGALATALPQQYRALGDTRPCPACGAAGVGGLAGGIGGGMEAPLGSLKTVEEKVTLEFPIDEPSAP